MQQQVADEIDHGVDDTVAADDEDRNSSSVRRLKRRIRQLQHTLLSQSLQERFDELLNTSSRENARRKDDGHPAIYATEGTFANFDKRIYKIGQKQQRMEMWTSASVVQVPVKSITTCTDIYCTVLASSIYGYSEFGT
jgi:hypothetical protein